MRRRQAQEDLSPVEVAEHLLLSFNRQSRIKLFRLGLDSTNKPTNQFYDGFYQLSYKFTSGTQMEELMYDDYDSPTDFGVEVANEVYLLVDAMLSDAILYDAAELAERTV